MSAPTAAVTEQRASVSGRGLPVVGIFLNWGSLIVGVLVSLVLTPLMIQGLGQYYYGMWILVMSVSDQYGLLDLGMTAALSRFAGYFKGSGERAAMDEVFSVSFLLALAVAVIICAVTVGLAPFLASFFGVAASDRPTFIRLIVLLGVTTAIAFPERTLAAYLRGIQRFDLFNAVATGALLIRAILFFIALRAGAGIVTIALITAVMGFGSFAAHFIVVRRADPGLRVSLAHVTVSRMRQLFGFSIYAFVASLGTRLISRVDSIVIGRILSVSLIAPFNIASRLTDYFLGVFSGVYGPVLSAMSELEGASKRKELQILFLRSSRYTALLSLFMGTLLIVDGFAFLTLWLGSSGLDLDLTYRVLVILTICYTVNQAQLPSWTVINARARHQILAWLILGEGVISIALSVYWGISYGLLGIALGTTVPSVIQYVFIVPYYALRVIDLSPSAYLRVLARPVLATAMFSAICFYIGSHQIQSLFVLGVCVLLQLLAAVFIAYLVGLPQAERRTVWQAVVSVRRTFAF